MTTHPAIVIGGGPAGLTAALELARRRQPPLVLEKAEQVGGLARTEVYQGYRLDIGGHRFYTRIAEVEQLWHTMLGDHLMQVPRLSRIYYRRRYFDYPIDLANTLMNLGIVESLLTLASYLHARVFPYRREDTVEQWIINRFGRRLYRAFFKTYTEKVWGIPCHLIQADWVAQRIRGLSFAAAVSDALFRTNDIKSLVKQFEYPTLGPGMMWERFQAEIERLGGRVELSRPVTRLIREDRRIVQVITNPERRPIDTAAVPVLSSMPLGELILNMDPPPPVDVLSAAHHLHYRSLILVALIVKRKRLFPDNWLYIHNPDVRVGRIQNFGNWSAAMVPDSNTSSLGMEYFCDEGDAFWNLEDSELLSLARTELAELGLAQPAEVIDGTVIRQPKAYPVYDPGYREQVEIIRRFMDSLENLQTLGRNGMHRYDNLDHAMFTGMLAVRNLQGEQHDLWNVNAERVYYEQFVT